MKNIENIYRCILNRLRKNILFYKYSFQNYCYCYFIPLAIIFVTGCTNQNQQRECDQIRVNPG